MWRTKGTPHWAFCPKHLLHQRLFLIGPTWLPLRATGKLLLQSESSSTESILPTRSRRSQAMRKKSNAFGCMASRCFVSIAAEILKPISSSRTVLYQRLPRRSSAGPQDGRQRAGTTAMLRQVRALTIVVEAQEGRGAPLQDTRQ